VPFEFLELIIVNGFRGRRQLPAIALKFRIDRMLMEDFFAIYRLHACTQFTLHKKGRSAARARRF
jgi:hypothetical protein